MNLPLPSRGLAIALLGTIAALQTQVGGASQLQHEDDLRAALVLGFARFSEWPVSREGPIIIAVVGRPSMATALERVSVGKLINGRTIQIRQVRQPSQASGAHILYFGRSPGLRLAEAVQEARGPDNKWPLLTIGEEDRFLAAGGAVHLFEEDGRMSFEVNLAALQAANVSISSKLLRLGYTSGAGRRARSAP